MLFVVGPPLQDVHFCKLREENGSDWKVVCDVSPRTAKLRWHFHGAGVMGPCSDSEEAEPQMAQLEAVFCWPCNMTLNGPTQYQDHLKGKVHRKYEQVARAGPRRRRRVRPGP